MENIYNSNFFLDPNALEISSKPLDKMALPLETQSTPPFTLPLKKPKKTRFVINEVTVSSSKPSLQLKAPSNRDEVYQEYLKAYEQINQLIESLYKAISSLSKDQETLRTELQERIQKLEALKGYGNDELPSLFLTYQAAYTGKMSYADFESIKNQILELASAIKEGQNTSDPIEANKKAGQSILDNLIKTLNDEIKKIDSFIKKIQQLEAEQKALEAYPDKNETALAKLALLKSKIAALIALQEQILAKLPALNEQIATCQAFVNQLNSLTSDESNAELAAFILAEIKELKNSFLSNEGAVDNLLPSDLTINDCQRLIREIQDILDPKPAYTPKIENGVWYIDWTSWDFPVPEGVDTVNIFVGQIIEKNGKPTIDGFGNMSQDPAKLQAFIDACHAKGIAVKVSIGGGGGSYDRCWDRLTEANVGAYAQGMVDFCHQYGIEGVDFDYEEFLSADQERLVGRLIKEFKQLDPSLSTSICTNAGFDTWKQVVQNILDGACDEQGNCAVDRLYIMSYYDPIQNEKAWVLQWASWLKERYHFDPAQITVGLDNFDAHAYSIEEFARWAFEQGFSTCYWAFNPTQASIANQDEQTIWDIYHPTLKAPTLMETPAEFRG